MNAEFYFNRAVEKTRQKNLMGAIEDYYPIIFEHSEIYIEDNNDLWRNLPETLKARKFNLDEKIKLETEIENENKSQEKLNKYLGL